jgi:copper chaperone CopZ
MFWMKNYAFFVIINGIMQILLFKGNITLMIDGMMCEHCVRHVKEALESVDGVTDINVDLAGNKATVTASPDKIQSMIDAITAEDYEVTDVINAQ